MMCQLRRLACLAFLVAVVSCDPAPKKSALSEEGVLLEVGSVEITQADLDYHLQEKHSGRMDEEARRKALDELAERARFTQAARDAGLDDDPLARAEIARILTTRLKEKLLYPKLKEAAVPVPEARLRELYESEASRFQSPEKRQVAVLWLNPGADPDRGKAYQDKMTKAREWYFSQSDLAEKPDQGFSVLAVDYSEHAATRFKGGVLGWIDREGGSTDWSRVVAETAFSLGNTGDVSPVIVRPEGVFLVRLMVVQPVVQKPFESVRAVLEREEQARLREQLELEFNRDIQSKYPAAMK